MDELQTFANEEPSLNLLNGVIYAQNNVQIDLSTLYVMFLERILHLSNGFRALVGFQNASVKKTMEFFAREDVQESFKREIYLALQRQKKNHREKSDIAHYTQEKAAKLLTDSLIFAFTTKALAQEEAEFWLQFSGPSCRWRKAWSKASKFAKTMLTNNNDKPYKPWLLIIREKLLAVENDANQALPRQEVLNKRIKQVCQWLASEAHSNLVLWLLNFLFNENYHDTKRQFLFIQGPPNTGKSFFLNVILPPNLFCVKNRSFAHFGDESPGIYELHLVLFDDPGEIKGKSHQLDSSILLNLAKYSPDSYHSLPVKHGFMRIKRAQIAIISNQEYTTLFSTNIMEAMKTRLMEVTFTRQEPFPLRALSEQDASSIAFPSNLNFVEDPVSNELQAILVNPPLQRQQQAAQDEPLSEDLIFYIFWRAIFTLAPIVFQQQKMENLIPNDTLRNQMLASNNIYHTLCQINEADLIKFLHNNEIPPKFIYMS